MTNGDDDTHVVDEIIIGDNDESPMVIRMLKKIVFDGDDVHDVVKIMTLIVAKVTWLITGISIPTITEYYQKMFNLPVGRQV